MCGIAGFIDSQLSVDEAIALLTGMLRAIAHRGPDFRGQWQAAPVFLGHNRLSIIDVSEAGHQPMHYRQAVIVYNGEVYNYVELRQQLQALGYRFSSDSDTEVILAAYHAWGQRCVEKFVGMWAFALWDIEKQLLFCSRDRFGIKPFYFIHRDQRFYFASEYKALKPSPLFSARLNLPQIYRTLQLGWIAHPSETFFHCVQALPPAHNLVFQNGRLKVYRYWDIDPEANLAGLPPEEKKARFRELFLQSVRQHMRSDVPVGGCLSGGLDSSSIVSAMAHLYPGSQIKTFTIFYTGPDGVDERPWARQVAEAYPAIRPYYYSPTSDELQAHLLDFLDTQEVPVPGSSPFSQYFLMRLAREQGVKVVLDGQGADEYLAGYYHSFYRYLAARLRQLEWLASLAGYWRHVRRQRFGAGEALSILAKTAVHWLRDENAALKLEYFYRFPFLPASREAAGFAFTTPFDGRCRFHQHLYYLTFYSVLPNLLHFEDRNSMRFSLESRVPFLDHRLVEFVFALGMEDKIHQAQSKYILRQSLSGIVPEPILQRRDKKGFVTPGEVRWIRGPFRHLLEQDYSGLDMLNQRRVKQLLEQYRKGDNRHAKMVWRLAMLKLWLSRL